MNDATLSPIQALVEGYARFYRAGKGQLSDKYACTRPLMIAIDLVWKSPVETARDDLILMVAGAEYDLMESIRDGHAKGFDPIFTDLARGMPQERLEAVRICCRAFAATFVDHYFAGECGGRRAELPERRQRLQQAANAYYLSQFTPLAARTGEE